MATSAPGIAKAASKQAPEWVRETPGGGFNLTAFDLDDCSVPEQDIELTRAEFESLKQHLAVMRGYVVRRRANRERRIDPPAENTAIVQ